MSEYRVEYSRRADRDASEILDWLGNRSRTGASRWLDALDQMVVRLRETPLSSPRAEEADAFSEPVRQILFRTKRGNTYRALYVVRDQQVTILTVLEPFHTFTFAADALTETAEVHQQHLEEHLQTDDRLEEKIRASGVACTHIRAEHQHLNEAVRLTAEAQDCDLVVMPAHERHGLLGRAVDSETVKLLSHSSLPVLVLH